MNGHHSSQGNLRRGQNPAYGPLRPIVSCGDAIISKMRPPRALFSVSRVSSPDMHDKELWDMALQQTSREFHQLSPRLREECCRLLGMIAALKERLCRLAEDADSVELCRECNGACCYRGKYHFAVADALLFLCRNQPVPVPVFDDGPQCPWMGRQGCRLAPELRPFTCVVFNCELVEQRMSAERVAEFYGLEQQLRAHCAELELMLGGRPVASLLRTGERSATQRAFRIFAPQQGGDYGNGA